MFAVGGGLDGSWPPRRRAASTAATRFLGGSEVRSKKAARTEPQVVESDLARLIAAERLLDAARQETRAEAERLVEAARRDGEQAEAAATHECEAAAHRLRATIQAERDRELESITKDATRQVRAFHAVADARIREWSEIVLDRLLAAGAEP